MGENVLSGLLGLSPILPHDPKATAKGITGHSCTRIAPVAKTAGAAQVNATTPAETDRYSVRIQLYITHNICLLLTTNLLQF